MLSRRRVFGLGAGIVAGSIAGCSTPAATPRGRDSPAPPKPAPSLITPPLPTLDSLSRSLSRPLLRPANPHFDSAAELFNSRFTGLPKPAAIAACSTAGDVERCVVFAASSGTPFALRSGGHSYAGWSTSTGLVIDLRALRRVDVDLAAGTVTIGAGAILSEVYAALAAKRVAIAAGSCPTVGITGLTLGGGVGVLSRAFGLTCDALIRADIVTADGTLRTVDSGHDEDLFWALRGGGGGSFGAVVSLTLAVQPAPTVSLFYYRWDIAHGEAVLDAWQSFIATAPKEIWSSAKLLADPSVDSATAIVAGTWIGEPREMEQRLAPLLAEIEVPPASSSMSTLSYLDAMLAEAECGDKSADACASAALTPAERLPFSATSAFLPKGLPTQGVSAAVAIARGALEVPGLVEGGLSIDSLGGAVASAEIDTAVAFRHAFASVQFSATWAGARAPTPFDAFTRAARETLLPWTGDSAYVNYADPGLADYTSAYWGEHYQRLRNVKRDVDPYGLFTFPQSVRAEHPAGE